MVSERPADRDALLRINGVGQAKLERYGDEFLAVLRRAADAEHPLTAGQDFCAPN
jgi:superfamily II DNA helicase RecQ